MLSIPQGWGLPQGDLDQRVYLLELSQNNTMLPYSVINYYPGKTLTKLYRAFMFSFMYTMAVLKTGSEMIFDFPKASVGCQASRTRVEEFVIALLVFYMWFTHMVALLCTHLFSLIICLLTLGYVCQVLVFINNAEVPYIIYK